MKTRSLSGVTNVLPVRTALRTTSQLALTDVIDIRDVIAAPPATVDTSPGINGRPLVEQVDPKVNPRWLQLASSWHQAGRYPGPVTADLGLAFGTLLLVGMPIGVALPATLVLLASGLLFGLWKRRLPYEAQGVLWYLRHLAPASAAVGFFLATSTTALTTNQVTFRTLAMSSALIGARAVLWLAIGSARRRGKGLQSALVVGPPARIEQVKHRLRTYPEAGLRFEAAYTPGPCADGSPEAGRTLVNSLLGEYDVDHVVCVPDQVEETVFLDFVRFSKGQVDISLVLPVATLCAGQVRSSIGDLGVLPVRLRASWGSAMAKRIVDVAGAAILLALLSPLLLLTGAAIRLSDGGPALFRQPRVGRDGKTFTVFKFRSMVLGAELLQADYQSENFVKCGLLFKLDKDPRVTPIGSVIRRFSIDELPQLINVLRGEMSLVGPRPLAVQPDRFDLRAQIRHQVNPGITGLWQALGANALEYEDMLNLDLAYVTSRSFGVDFLTMLRTVPALLNRRAPY